jgi:hypothetical protein
MMPPLALWRSVRRWRILSFSPHFEVNDQQVCLYGCFYVVFLVRIPGGATVRCPVFALISCLKYGNTEQCAPCLVTPQFRRIFTFIWYWRTISDLAAYFSRVRRIAKSDQLLASSLSVLTEQLGSHWTDFLEISYLSIFRTLSRKFRFNQNPTSITATWHEYQHTFLAIPRSVIRRTRNTSDESCRENQNTRVMLNNSTPPPRQKWCPLWDSVEKYCRAVQATDNNMADAHCMLDT